MTMCAHDFPVSALGELAESNVVVGGLVETHVEYAVEWREVQRNVRCCEMVPSDRHV